jgi:hypothetical protein
MQLQFRNQGIFPNPKVIFISRPKSPNIINIPVAHRRYVGTREAARSGGQYRATDTIWKFDRVHSDPTEIRIGWSVNDADGNKFRILERNITDLTCFWKLTCRNLALDIDFSDRVHIRRMVASKTDLAGRNQRRYEMWRRNVPAAFHRGDPTTANNNVGASRLAESGSVYLLEDPGLLASDIICLKDGRGLEVTGITDPDSLDALVTVQVTDNGYKWTDEQADGSVGDI